MKIVLLVSSMNGGGAERVAATLANAWVKRGDEVILMPCFTHGSGKSFYPLDNKVQLEWLAQSLPTHKLLARLLKPFVLRQKIKQFEADVIVSFLTNVNVTVLFSTLGLQQKIIVCERTNPVARKNISTLLDKLRWLLYPKASAVMLQTEQAAQAFSAQNPRLKKVAVIANPLPLELEEIYKNQVSRHLLARDSQQEDLLGGATADDQQVIAAETAIIESAQVKSVLLAMGRLMPSKQFDILIRCFAQIAKQLPNWQLHIYGQGPLQSQLQQQIDELKLGEQIKLQGQSAEPWQKMRSAQAFAMTSRLEGFPNVLLEAMACGLPCVCFDCPSGPAELTDQGQTALLVPLNDEAAFVKALQRLLGNHELRRHLAQSARNRVLAQYSLQAILQQWDGLFAQVDAAKAIVHQVAQVSPKQSTSMQTIVNEAHTTKSKQVDPSALHKKLRIVHLISGLGQGGAEAVLLRLVQNASDQEHIVVSFTDGGVYQTVLEQAGAKVITLNMRAGKVTFVEFLRMRRLLKKLKPNVVQTWMYHADFIGGLAARLAGIKAVAWGIRNSGVDLQKSSRSSYLLARYFGWVSRFIPQKIICCAYLAKQRHQAWGYASKKMVVIQNGYDLQRWHANPDVRQQLRQQWQIAEDESLIGFVARWNPLKDHATLIQALSIALQSNQKIKCVLIGKDMTSDNPELMQLLTQFNVHKQVILLGMCDDVPDLMTALDLHVLSSIAEGFPNVVAEAMASEVPCVVTNVGDAAAIVADLGWVVEPREPNQLAQAINTGLSKVHSSQGLALRKACRESVIKRFSLSMMISAYEQVWMEIAQNKND